MTSAAAPGPVIRRIAPDDKAAWLPLWQGYLEFYETELADDVTEATFTRILDPNDDVHGALAVDADGRAIGFVHWLTHPGTWSHGDNCYLEDLYVAPDARAGGVGRALIGAVREWATDAGCAKVYWLTHETNARAQRLYDDVAEKTGFIHYEIPLDR